MSDLEIKKIIEIDASPEVVFEAISDPEEMSNWFPDAVMLEPKVGGNIKFSFYKDSVRACGKRDSDSFNEGRILEFESNKKLVYTWKWAGVPDFPETIVTWELEQIGKNKTKLTLTHKGFSGKEPERMSFNRHDQGWTFTLNDLVSYCKK